VALRDWLPLVLRYVKPWMSERDLAAGDRWALQLGRTLEDSAYGIVVLTKDSFANPWILFEAGALSRSFDGDALCPLLLDVAYSDILASPLYQFHAKKANRESIKSIIDAINGRAKAPEDVAIVDAAFKGLWLQLHSALEMVPHLRDPKPERSQAEILEDIAGRIGRLEAKVDEAVGAGASFDGETRPIPDEADVQHFTEPTVVVKVRGEFPGVRQGMKYFYLAHDNMQDLARIAGVSLEDFNKTWTLTNVEHHLRRSGMPLKVVSIVRLERPTNAPAGSDAL
jgi:hypothetical protein